MNPPLPPGDQPPAGSDKKLYTFEDEVLEEVEVSDDPPPDDDDSTIWTDDGDNVEETFEDITGPVEDLSVFSFNGHTDSVYCTAINPHKRGTVITGGGDDRAFLWVYDTSATSTASAAAATEEGAAPTPAAPKQVFELTGHTDTVASVGFNFDGTLALTGSYDGTVKVWKVDNGELLLTLDGPEDVEFAEWHPKGNAIIAGSKDGTVWMWLAHNGQCVQVFAGHEGGVTCGVFTKDGKTVCTGGEDGTVRVWAPKTGVCKHVFEGHFGHEGPVTALDCSNDGDFVLSGSVDGKVLLLQLSGKRMLQTFVHSQPKTLTGSDGQPLPRPPRGNDAAMDDDDEAAFGEFVEENENTEAEATHSVECVGFANGDLRWAASGGMDSTLKVWDIVTGSCRSVCAHGGSVVALRWHSSLPVISTAALDHVLRVWDARGGTLLHQLTGHRNLVTNLDMVTYPASDTEEAVDVIVSVSDDKTAKVFHTKDYFA